MTRRSITILGLLFTILVVEIVILAPGEVGVAPEKEKTQLQNPASPSENTTGQVMQDAHVVEARPSGKEWELWAKKGVRPKDTASWTIEQVEVKFFAQNGVTYNVTGDKGFVLTTQGDDVRDVRIEGHVVTHSSNHYIFKTDTALYETSKRILKTPGDVEMLGPKDKDGSQLVLTGTNMRADLNTNDIEIEQNVHAREKIRDSKTVIIVSQRAKFSGKTKSAHFIGNVVIDVDTLRITGPEATFSYKPGSDSVDSVLVAGGVRVTDVDKYATAEQVTVHFDEDKFVFNGSPRVVQSGDELRGDEIVFLNNGRKVQVSKAHIKLERKDLDAPPKDLH